MSYRRSSNKRTFAEKIGIATLGILFFLLFFMYGDNSVTGLRGKFVHAVAPLWELGDALFGKDMSVGAYLSSKKELEDENRKLTERIRDLELIAISSKKLREENESLKEELGRDARENNILATVLARPSYLPFDTLIIDVGSDEEVRLGALVIAKDDIALGKVIEVFPHESRVLLYSSAGQKANVIIGEEHISAEALGLGGGNFKIMLPRDVTIAKNALIIIPALNGKVLGAVGAIIANPSDALQEILFKTPLNVQEIEWVYVETR